MHLVGEVTPVSRLAPAVALWVAALLALVLAPVAQATYPGENGRIYFSALCEGCNQYDVYSVNPDGSGLENVTDVVTDGPDLPDNAYDPSVSADGKRMAFAVDSQATSQIWIMNTDGTGALQLTNDEMIDYAPTISPDGSKIVWNHWPEYTDHDIWVMNSDGSGPQSFYNGSGEDYYPRFTPDGQTIVMQSETGDMDIRKVPFTPMVPPLSTSTGVADNDEFLEAEPTVSPDGTRVIFTQRPTSNSLAPFDLYSVSINGGPTTPLFPAVSTSGPTPAYSPDGTKIVFGSNGVAMIGNADGSGTPAPLDIGALNSPYGFDWTPKPVLSSPPPPPGDIDPPQTKILKGPKGKIHSHAARFRFSSDEAGSSFRCKLDRGKFSRCFSPKRYQNLKAGKHVFQVFAIDIAGNRDQSPAKRTFTVLKEKRKGARHAH
jgi:hypothetical protein